MNSLVRLQMNFNMITISVTLRTLSSSDLIIKNCNAVICASESSGPNRPDRIAQTESPGRIARTESPGPNRPDRIADLISEFLAKF